jgi:hypothetical protein
MSEVFDSQGDVIHHQPQDHAQWMMEPAAAYDRSMDYVLGGVCPFCKQGFMEEVPSTEQRFIRDWDRGSEFKAHLRYGVSFQF